MSPELAVESGICCLKTGFLGEFRCASLLLKDTTGAVGDLSPASAPNGSLISKSRHFLSDVTLSSCVSCFVSERKEGISRSSWAPESAPLAHSQRRLPSLPESLPSSSSMAFSIKRDVPDHNYLFACQQSQQSCRAIDALISQTASRGTRLSSKARGRDAVRNES